MKRRNALAAALGILMAGTVASVEEELVVSVQVDNRGDVGVAPLVVQGELLGGYDEVQKDAGIAAGGDPPGNRARSRQGDREGPRDDRGRGHQRYG